MRDDDVLQRARAAASGTTDPLRAMLEYQAFVAKEMQAYRWQNRFLPYRIIDFVLRRKP